MTTKKSSAKAPKKPTPKSDAMFVGGDARIMDVAALICCRYQRARDLMLARRFGEVKKDHDGKLVVSRTNVDAFIDEKKRGAGKL